MDEGVADTACYTHRPLIGKRLGGEAWYIVGSPIRRNPPPYALESTDRIEYPSGRIGATSFQGNSSSMSSPQRTFCTALALRCRRRSRRRHTRHRRRHHLSSPW